MVSINEAMRHSRVAPVTAPDQLILVGELAQEVKRPLPGRFAIDAFYQVASQSVMVHTYGPQLCRTLIEQRKLPFFTSIGLEDHERDTPPVRRIDNRLHALACDGLQQSRISHSVGAFEPSVLHYHIGIESPHFTLHRHRFRDSTAHSVG